MKTRYYYGYNIVLAGFLIQTFCIGVMFTYGVFSTEFQHQFGWSRTLISGAAIGPILAGHIFDITGGYGDAFMALTFFASAGFVPIFFLRHINGVGRQ